MKTKKLSCAEKLKALAADLRRRAPRNELDAATMDQFDAIVAAINANQSTDAFESDLVSFVRGIEASYVQLGYRASPRE